MMEGIEVLAVGAMGIGSTVNWGLIIIVGLICGGIMGTVIGLYERNIFLGLGIGFLIFLGAGAIVAIATEAPVYTVPTYKVTVSDTISINEFYERYEVLKQDGKIFTIKEKTEDGNNSLSAP